MVAQIKLAPVYNVTLCKNVANRASERHFSNFVWNRFPLNGKWNVGNEEKIEPATYRIETML